MSEGPREREDEEMKRKKTGTGNAHKQDVSPYLHHRNVAISHHFYAAQLTAAEEIIVPVRLSLSLSFARGFSGRILSAHPSTNMTTLTPETLTAHTHTLSEIGNCSAYRSQNQ